MLPFPLKGDDCFCDDDHSCSRSLVWMSNLGGHTSHICAAVCGPNHEADHAAAAAAPPSKCYAIGLGTFFFLVFASMKTDSPSCKLQHSDRHDTDEIVKIILATEGKVNNTINLDPRAIRVIVAQEMSIYKWT